ncbi:MAG TPA: hypothetical protein VMB80_16645 [Candidatus Acidoferrum sp.]|nr:hypothetical protein [Candidatus Acidoferrum sp.]
MKDFHAVLAIFGKASHWRSSPLARCLTGALVRRPALARRQAGLVALGLVIASVARAQSGSENTGLFSTLGQLNAGVTVANALNIQPNACVPTAVANGLAFLENYQLSIGQPDPLSFTPTYASVNNLATAMGTYNNTYYQYYDAGNNLVYTSVNVRNDAAAAALGAVSFATRSNIGGTPTTWMFNGLQSYLGAGGANPSPTVSISGVVGGATPAGWLRGAFNPGMNIALNTIPTAAYLANALNSNFAVELTLEWGVFNGNVWTSQGGHEVTLDAINLGNAGTGTIQFLDPYGTSAGFINGTLTLNADGYLYVSEQAAAPADFNPSDLQDSEPGAVTPTLYGRIDVAMIESVPEPSFGGMAGAALMILWGRQRLRCRRI